MKTAHLFKMGDSDIRSPKDSGAFLRTEIRDWGNPPPNIWLIFSVLIDSMLAMDGYVVLSADLPLGPMTVAVDKFPLAHAFLRYRLGASHSSQ